MLKVKNNICKQQRLKVESDRYHMKNLKLLYLVGLLITVFGIFKMAITGKTMDVAAQYLNQVTIAILFYSLIQNAD